MPLTRPMSRGSALHVVVWVVSAALLVGVTALVLLDRYLREQYEPALGQLHQAVTRDIGFFCEQQVLLAQDPWFHEPRTSGDAGPLLNAWVGWSPIPAAPNLHSPLILPAALLEPHAVAKDWLQSKAEVSSLDFSWMGRLRDFDRWETLQHTPSPLPARVIWVDAAQPDFSRLRLWAKLRLLQGLRTGQPVEAARDVRHLAWLAYRTDTLMGGIYAASMLGLEREAYDSLPSPPPEWHPMSREQVARMRAIILSSGVFSNVAAPAEVARQARRCGAPAPSACIALGEGAVMMTYLRPLAEGQYPEAYAALAEDIEALSCSTSFARTVWERGASLEEAPSKLAQRPRWLDFVPASYARKYSAGVLVSMGTPELHPLEQFRVELESGSFQPDSP